MQSNGKFTEARQNMVDKANRALYAMLRHIPPECNCKTFIYLFRTCILPVLIYGSEIWGIEVLDENKWDKTTSEKLHLKFCRNILGLNKFGANLACRAELGCFPLLIDTKKNLIKYWLRIQGLPDKCLTKQAYYEQMKFNLPWCSSVQNLVIDSRIQTSKTDLNMKNIDKTLKENYITFWKQNVNQENTKLRTYAKFKNTYNFEFQFYLNCLPKKHQVCMSRFRTSNHCLAIEKGRHTQPKTPIEKRICNLCSQNKIEDEVHFLLECDRYKYIRHELLTDITLTNAEIN
ncbi:uncharacterized protein LOC144342321 [Saccoglossus kowalevskii]